MCRRVFKNLKPHFLYSQLRNTSDCDFTYDCDSGLDQKNVRDCQGRVEQTPSPMADLKIVDRCPGRTPNWNQTFPKTRRADRFGSLDLRLRWRGRTTRRVRVPIQHGHEFE